MVGAQHWSYLTLSPPLLFMSVCRVWYVILLFLVVAYSICPYIRSLLFPLLAAIYDVCMTDDTYTIGNQIFFASDGRDHSSGSAGVSGGGGSGGSGGRRVCRVYDIEHTKYRKPQWYVILCRLASSRRAVYAYYIHFLINILYLSLA